MKNGNSYHPPSRCSMNAKVPVMRSSSGRCLRKMHLVPAGTPGGACQVLPASSSHNWSEMKISTRYFYGIRYESVPAGNPWGLSPPAGMVAKSGLSSPSALLGPSGLASPAPSSSVIGIFTPCSPPSASRAPPSYGNGILMERREPLGVYVEQTFLSSVETQGSHFVYVLFVFFPFCTLILVGELVN